MVASSFQLDGQEAGVTLGLRGTNVLPHIAGRATEFPSLESPRRPSGLVRNFVAQQPVAEAR